MAFEKLPPEWNDVGVEPPQSKKDTGFQPGEKPPAQWINWLFNKIYLAIKELQEKAVEKVTGKGLSTEDYTAEEKTKLEGIDTGANKTVINNTLTSISTTEALSAAQGKALKVAADAHSADNTAHGVGNKIDKSLATGISQVLVSSAAGTWVMKTMSQLQALLGLDTAAYSKTTDYATAAQGTLATNALPKAGGTMSGEINCADNLLTRPYIKDYAEVLGTVPATTGTVPLDLTTGNVFNITPTGAITLALTNPPASGRTGSITVKINMPATVYAITFPSSVKWDGDKIPTFSASKTAILTFVTFDAGARWYGMAAGTNFTT